MNFSEFKAVCLELIKQYKTIEPPVREAIDVLLSDIRHMNDDDIEIVIHTIHSAFYDKN